MTDNEQQNEQRQLDERVQKVLNVIAYHIGSFHNDRRKGTLKFEIAFDNGELPEDGFRQTIDESVL